MRQQESRTSVPGLGPGVCRNLKTKDMKKTFIGAFALLCLLAAPVTFCSCGDDDDDDKTAAPATVTADVIVGTYSGNMKVVGYTDAPAIAYAEITRMSSNSVKVNLLARSMI